MTLSCHEVSGALTHSLDHSIPTTTTTTTTTTFITYNTSYSEKFVHPNLARLIELGGAKIKYLINIFTMTKITKGNNYYFKTRAIECFYKDVRYYSGIQIEILVN